MGNNLVWSPWPDLGDGTPPGPNSDFQRLLKWYLYPEETHHHDVDHVLCLGAKGSGKTAGAAYTCIDTALYAPGFQAIVGAKDVPQLNRTSKKAFKERFTLPGGEEWAHPLVKHKPVDKDNRLILRTWNESKRNWTGEPAHIWFVHFSEPESLQGAEGDMIIFEEPTNIRDKVVYMELLARLRGKRWKYQGRDLKQVILLANPSSQHTWLDEEYALEQLAPDYDGPVLEIGEKCRCHLCDRCLFLGKGSYEYVDNICPNPECAAISKYHPEPGKKLTPCPGNQQYHRVMTSSTFDNTAMSGAMIDSMLGSYDKTTAQSFIYGKQVYIGEGKVYPSFTYSANVAGSSTCVLKHEVELEPDRPAVWSGDWNVKPQCSGIIQEYSSDLGEYAVKIDEIIEWDAEPHHIANKLADYLIERKFTSYVDIYGDPTGFGGQASSEKSKYQIFMDTLKSKGIKSKLRVKHKLKSVKDSVQEVNACFRNAKDEIRYFINKRCLHTIKSFQMTEWDKNGKWVINKQCDHNAYNQFKREPEETRNNVIHLTHPSDSDRYYLMIRFALWKTSKAPQFIQFPGEMSVTDIGGRVIEKDRRKEGDTDSPIFKPGDNAGNQAEKPKTFKDLIKSSWGDHVFTNDSGGQGLSLFQ